MTLVRWRPVRDLVNFRDEINRLFGGVFESSGANSENSGFWLPAADVMENKDDVVVNLEIPGMNKEDIKVTVQDNVLSIRGEKKHQTEEKDANYHRVERSYGAFTRSFTLPSRVKADEIKAVYENGVLKVALPKSEEAKPKEIPVSVKGR